MTEKRATLDLLHYLRLLNRYKWLISIAVIIAGLLNGIKGLDAPRTYKARVTFFIFLERPTPAVSSLQNLASGIFNVPAMGSNITVEALIKSRRMAEGVLKRFFPEQGNDRRSEERAINRIRKMIEVAGFGAGSNALAIDVTTSDSQKAADIANFCVEYLEVLNQELEISPEKRFTKVLDAAVPPLYPMSRKIARKVLVTMLAMGLGLIAILFFIDYLQYLVRHE